MKFTDLVVLLPCHSLEDFPQYYDGDEAQGLLSAWSVLWHPSLLAAAGKLPKWFRADFPPDDTQGSLIVIPSIAERLLPAGWPARAEEEGALVVRHIAARDELLAAIFARSEPPQGPPVAALADDFLALGFCQLQLELLTRQMRYLSNLDEVHLERHALAAAQAACENNADLAREHLQRCFDVLYESRQRFYPVDAYLLDLTLVAETTLGVELHRELETPVPVNLLASAHLFERMATAQPAGLEAVRAALCAGRVSVAGGEYEERDLPLFSLEAIERELARGQEAYQRFLERPVRIFARRRFGLSPMLPQVLSRRGFLGCLHATLDDGYFAQIGKGKTRWQGLDMSVIDALGRLPLDARLDGSFLAFSQRLAETMDLDHVATLVLAHWPGDAVCWYGDLRRICAYAPVLGKFVTLEDYFGHTDAPGSLSRPAADEYRSPYLKQAVAAEARDPISRHVRRLKDEALQQAVDTLRCFSTLLAGHQSTEAAALGGDRSCDPATHVAGELAAQLGSQAVRHAAGRLLLNPSSFPRQALIPGPSDDGAIAAAASIAQVPALGFCWVPEAVEATRPRKKSAPPLANENVLANEFVEVTIDPATGGIRSIRDRRHRGNRLSQQLAVRLPGGAAPSDAAWQIHPDESNYSVMAADRVEITANSSAHGEITSRGRLVDRQGLRLASFEQRVCLTRGARWVDLEIRLELDADLPADPWTGYCAARFAWADEAAELSRSVHQVRQTTRLTRIEAPHFIEIREDDLRTAILTGGLPFHRRSGPRMLDTLLIVRGETERTFRLGIGLDLANPAATALELLGPMDFAALGVGPPTSQASGWFFNVDAAHVLATHWEPVMDAGQVRGFRARLLETTGQPGRVKLRGLRPLAEARQIDLQGETLVPLAVDADAVLIDFAAYEWVAVEALWK